MSIDFRQHTEREILMNMVPRLERAEKDISETRAKQNDLDTALGALKRDLIETEARISQKVDDRFDKVDNHLSNQDERLDKIVDAKRRWPQGAVITMTATLSLLVSLAVYGALRALHIM